MSINHRALFGIVVTSCTLFAAGSDSCFNLLNYSPPSFSYQLLDITPNISLNTGSTSETTKNESGITDEPTRTNSHSVDFNQPQLGVTARHTLYGWNGRTEWDINSNLSLNGNINTYGPEKSNGFYYDAYYAARNSRSGSTSGSFSVSATHYFKWPFFIGAQISPSVSGTANRQHDMSKLYNGFVNESFTSDSGRYSYEDNVTWKSNYNAGCSFAIHTGAGHIDNVSFAVAALNMLDRIAEVEKSYKGCSSADIQNLAALIEKMHKRRTFDSRIAFIENIDTLCSVIQKSGIVDDLSPRSVLELADQWNYAFAQVREKGFSVKFSPTASYWKTFSQTKVTTLNYDTGFTGSFSLQENDKNDFGSSAVTSKENNTWDRTQQFTYGVDLLGQYERPLSRYYQLSLLSSVSASTDRNWHRSFYWNDTIPIEYCYASPRVSGWESASLAYYPDTRTSLKVSQSIRYGGFFNYYDIHQSGVKGFKQPPKDNYISHSFSISFTGDANYYFSPTLQAGGTLGIRWQENYDSSHGNPPLHFDLSHYSHSDNNFNFTVSTNVTWSLF